MPARGLAVGSGGHDPLVFVTIALASVAIVATAGLAHRRSRLVSGGAAVAAVAVGCLALAGCGCLLSAITRSAPRRRAARTAHRPTAPSPTTATASPFFTPAMIAAWCPVDITSDRASSDFSGQLSKVNAAKAAPVPATPTS
jgi:hypothetical protein